MRSWRFWRTRRADSRFAMRRLMRRFSSSSRSVASGSPAYATGRPFFFAPCIEPRSVHVKDMLHNTLGSAFKPMSTTRDRAALLLCALQPPRSMHARQGDVMSSFPFYSAPCSAARSIAQGMPPCNKPATPWQSHATGRHFFFAP
jgi:hypothetical protein